MSCPECETDQVAELRALLEVQREALEYIEQACLCGHHTTRTKGFEYGEKHTRLGVVKDGGRWLTPRERIQVLRVAHGTSS